MALSDVLQHLSPRGAPVIHWRGFRDGWINVCATPREVGKDLEHDGQRDVAKAQTEFVPDTSLLGLRSTVLMASDRLFGSRGPGGRRWTCANASIALAGTRLSLIGRCAFHVAPEHGGVGPGWPGKASQQDGEANEVGAAGHGWDGIQTPRARSDLNC